MIVGFDSPFLVIWEVTRACALACVQCRADATTRRDPRELTTEEGFRLVDQVRAFGTPPPFLVLTGGTRCGARTSPTWCVTRRTPA